ncbi:MAG: CoA-binding protein [archaeon]
MSHLHDEIDVFFNPKSLAVVGASPNVDKAGHVIFKNFVVNKRRGIFSGELYAVNPNQEAVLGVKCYPSLSHITSDIEAVVVVVPAISVSDIVTQAAERKVRAAVIISAGFKEAGNASLEESIVQTARRAGMRILGPNCLGVYDSRSGVDMLFLPETKVLLTGDEVVATPRPLPGNMAVVSQSGAFGAAALDYLTGRELGISKFVSFGNKSDVAEPEMLSYLQSDEHTRVILLYAEGISRGREFLNVAKEVTKTKPVIALKAGRTDSGARAASSHTGSLAGADAIYEKAFIQSGVVRARDMDDFFHLGKAFSAQPPAKGDGIAILTDAGGAGVMAADECELKGIALAKLSSETADGFEELKERGKIPRFASNANPVDLTGSVTSEMFELSTKLLLDDGAVNGLIIIGLHHTPGLHEDFVTRVAAVVSSYRKSAVSCDIGETEMALQIRSRFDKCGIPCYSSPEDAARSMAGLVRYGTYLAKEGCYEAYVEDFYERRGSLLNCQP